MDKLLNPRNDAAPLLILSTQCIDYLIAEGRLLFRKLGKRRLILREAVERIVKREWWSHHACSGKPESSKPPLI